MESSELEGHIRRLLSTHGSRLAHTRLTLKKIRGGYENEVFLVKAGTSSLIFKRRFDGDSGGYEREFRMLTALRETRIAPHPLLFDRGDGAAIEPSLIIRRLPGETLARETLDRRAIRALADAFRLIHHLPVGDLDLPYECGFRGVAPYFSRVLDNFRHYLRGRVADRLEDNALVELLAALFERLSGHLERYAHLDGEPVRLALCHGDIRMHNMLLYRGMIFLLDWERSGIGDPAFEAGLIPIFCALDSEAQKYFYDAYIDLSIDSPRMLEKIEAYRLVHVLAWPMHMLSFLYRLKLEGCTTTWNPDEFVEAYLSEAYGWLAYAVRALAPVLGFPELAGMREPQLRSMGTLFAWNGQAL